MHSGAPGVACPKRVCGRAAPDAPERLYDQRRCTRSESSDVVPRIARERVPTMGIDLTPCVDAHGRRMSGTRLWTFRGGKTRRQATSGAEGSRAHCIIGVPPVFPICAKGDDQKLESQTLQRSQSQLRSCHATNTAAQAGRLCYFSLGIMPP